MEDPIPYVLSNDYYLSDDLSSQTLTNLLSTIIKIEVRLSLMKKKVNIT